MALLEIDTVDGAKFKLGSFPGPFWAWVLIAVLLTAGDPDIIDGIVDVLQGFADFMGKEALIPYSGGF